MVWFPSSALYIKIMELTIDECYAALLDNGTVVRFRFKGWDENGTVNIQMPPDGKTIPLISVFTEATTCLAYYTTSG
jgi:hypothetical protein